MDPASLCQAKQVRRHHSIKTLILKIVDLKVSLEGKNLERKTIVIEAKARVITRREQGGMKESMLKTSKDLADSGYK